MDSVSKIAIGTNDLLNNILFCWSVEILCFQEGAAFAVYYS